MGICLILVAVFVVLWLWWLIADEFSTIAEYKGYTDRKYFWYCFWFGLVGYLMVIALPVKNNKSEGKVRKYETPIAETKGEKIGNFPAQEFPSGSGIKQCPKCGVCYDGEFKSCPSCKYTDEAN